MKTLVGCLCSFIVATFSEACEIDRNECLFDWNVASLENCTVDISYGYKNSVTCSHFRISFATVHHPSVKDPESIEYRTTIGCWSNDDLPYKLLSKIKSTRNSLVFNNCQLPEDGSFGEGWPELEYLKFTNYGTIGPLKREHFSGLNKLRNLELFIDSNHQMPDDLFAGATKLNNIEMVVKKPNKNVFKNLNELGCLRLAIDSNESSNSFDTSEMKNLPSFHCLVLFLNSFTHLTKQFFVGSPNLEYLELHSNTIKAIDADVFEPLTNLKTIRFLHNKMTSLPQGLFSRKLKLEKVQIINSFVSHSLPSGLLANLPNLREIEISSRLTSIPSDLIRGSTNLELLNLQLNKLTSLPRDLLQDHTKLKIIALFGNDDFDTSSPIYFDNKSDLTEVTFDFHLNRN